MTREDLYGRLPVFLQHVACSLKGWQFRRTRYADPFRQLLREAESRSGLSDELIADYRDARLAAFVRHAAQTVPFYGRQFRELGVSPEEIRSLADLARLPTLSKRELQERPSELLSQEPGDRRLFVRHTSGTTGTSLRFVSTLLALQEQEAVAWRFRRWHGLDVGTWCAYVGGSRLPVPVSQSEPPFWRYNAPGRQIYFSTFHLAPAQLDANIGELRRRRPPWLHGLPSALALLAQHLLERGSDLGYEPRCITTAGENLLPQQAEAIERAFGVRPRQRYVLTEAAAHASECEVGSLHLDEDLAAVELVSENGNGTYRVVGTNFTNLATPLLRYETEDIATLAETPCGCGRPGRVLASVDGRLDDYIALPNGERVVSFDLSFAGAANIREAQVVQHEHGAVRIRLVPARTFSEEDREALIRGVRKCVGDEMRIDLECVERLPRSAAGKVRFSVSELPGGQAASVGRP